MYIQTMRGIIGRDTYRHRIANDDPNVEPFHFPLDANEIIPRQATLSFSGQAR